MDRVEKARRLAILRDDFEQYASLCLKIKTKEGAISPFLFNDPQKYIHAQLEKQLKETGRIRAILLKGRQQGASTYTEGRFYWRTSLNSGKQAFILTHEQAATDNLFGMAKRYHDNCYAGIRPTTRFSNSKELLFDARDSGYKVGTAGSRAVGRSGTIQYMHGSESAFWPNADEHFAGIMQCVPYADGTEVIIESTANGVGGKFHELWMQAVNGESEYIAVFVPWFWSAEYRKSSVGFVPTADELQKQTVYGVDLDQLAWRRSKIDEMGKDLADQEYPYCWQDAFLSSGRTVFDKGEMELALMECWTPKKRMVLENGKFVDRADGELKVWALPRTGERFAIGADPAEGLIHGDFSSADVVNVQTGEQVAQWHGHIAPDKFAHVLMALGKLYNLAICGIEVNNHGILTATVCRDAGYPNLYVQRKIDDGYSGDVEGARVGWMTTSKSKPYIIDQLSASLREGIHGICCRETVQEMQSFVIRDNGSYGAQEKCFDDRVLSYAIAQEMARQSPAYRKQTN